jgi:hypothetical protein
MALKTISTIYENGVFRPLEPVDYAEGEILRLEIVEITAPDGTPYPIPPALRSIGENPRPTSDRSAD